MFRNLSKFFYIWVKTFIINLLNWFKMLVKEKGIVLDERVRILKDFNNLD